MSNFPSVTPTEARAAAASYGWSVVPHDNGGFFAQSGEHRMIVVFNEDGSFRRAHVREGRDGMDMTLLGGAVVGALAQYGRPRSPAISEEQNA